MTLKSFLAGAALAIVTAGAANASVTTHVNTASFISSPTQFNGFEGLGSTTSYPANTPYSEGGITVDYVGSANIWSTAFPSAQGNYSWYENGGGTGYTDITLTGGGSFNEIQFLAADGFYAGGAGLEYELLKGGSVIATGDLGPLQGYSTGFTGYYGFSGATFDEVQLQSQSSSGRSFNPNTQDAGAYDSIAIGSVPEPATWALMLVGIGGLGASLRSRRITVLAA